MTRRGDGGRSWYREWGCPVRGRSVMLSHVMGCTKVGLRVAGVCVCVGGGHRAVDGALHGPWSVPSMVLRTAQNGPCGLTGASARLSFFRYFVRPLYEGVSQPRVISRVSPGTTQYHHVYSLQKYIYIRFTGLGAADDDDDGDTCVREGGRCGTPSFCNRPYDAGSKHISRHVGWRCKRGSSTL